eukprot:CAMPEP_0119101814 /NCGR_PEP_ID=MMETSP1180-20130426/761_1 /TAXON_ID=3052 ORGANISM="Chlamydomonas cf sp, Strain CCMP681" /NCGR_SAMPLE_ID=MMETSP1180 /ASSEMBLY_ACC=CAM_ASM_000741 /LENGTH=171 /DNA_ID=CAMNT_0007085991 /DNA_START=102 /DNA_END=617 /DNA_ORIENTATION=+
MPLACSAARDQADSESSTCLVLEADDHPDGQPVVRQIDFARGERAAGDIGSHAADVMGIHGERVRCYMLPERTIRFHDTLGAALHMYIDMQGIDHKLAHNSNATQLYLIANLPEEPPELSLSSISGPVLLSASDKNDNYKNLTLEDWETIKKACRDVQSNALFMPLEQSGI